MSANAAPSPHIVDFFVCGRHLFVGARPSISETATTASSTVQVNPVQGHVPAATTTTSTSVIDPGGRRNDGNMGSDADHVHDAISEEEEEKEEEEECDRAGIVRRSSASEEPVTAAEKLLQLAARLDRERRKRSLAMEALRETERKVKAMERERMEMRRRSREEAEEMASMEWGVKLKRANERERRWKERVKEMVEEKKEMQREMWEVSEKKNALIVELHECKEAMKALQQRQRGRGKSSRWTEINGEGVTGSLGGGVTEEEEEEAEMKMKEMRRALDKAHTECREQGITIESLRMALDLQLQQQEQKNGVGIDSREEAMGRLKREVVRLSGVEQVLRKEAESQREAARAATELNASLGQRLKRLYVHIRTSQAGSSTAVQDAEDDVRRFLQCSHHNEELEKLRAETQYLDDQRTKLQQEVASLRLALSHTNRTIQGLEHQLVLKGKELEIIYEDLQRTKEERDATKSEADFMGQEAIRLVTEIRKLSRRVEDLDADVMLKDGQITILHGALHDSNNTDTTII